MTDSATSSLNKDSWGAFGTRLGIAGLMGFASGLPLLLTGSLLQAWLNTADVSLTAIGFFSLVGLPYTLKFLWAPLFDRYDTPLGRRRGWLLVTQLGLAGALYGLSLANPHDLAWIAGLAFLVTFLSASQDIVIDAYRREILRENEQGLGAALAVNGYRLGMLLAGGGGLVLADFVSFSVVYQLMAGVIVLLMLVTCVSPEPTLVAGRPQNLREAVIDPFVEYFQRPQALTVLLFILLYKLGDTLAGHLTTPFYLSVGFSRTEIGTIVNGFGLWATILGGLIGGGLLLKLGLYRGLWIFGILQAISTAGFVLLAFTGPKVIEPNFVSGLGEGLGLPLTAAAVSLAVLGGVVAFENLTAGMGTAAYVALMANLTHQRFTATQYALLSSLMGIPRVILSAPMGIVVETVGWVPYFIGCALIAIPGLVLLFFLKDATTRTASNFTSANV